MTIYKYEIKPRGLLDVPKSAKLMRVHSQGEAICVWLAVNPEEEEHRQLCFSVVPTGCSVPSALTWNYLDTVFMDNGMVFHVFISALDEKLERLA